MIINPLEFLQLNESSLDGKTLEQVQEDITTAYKSSSRLMRNGRTFFYNFKRTFGGVNWKDGVITDTKAL